MGTYSAPNDLCEVEDLKSHQTRHQVDRIPLQPFYKIQRMNRLFEVYEPLVKYLYRDKALHPKNGVRVGSIRSCLFPDGFVPFTAPSGIRKAHPTVPVQTLSESLDLCLELKN